MISTSLVRMVVLKERVRLINLNRFVWANIGSQIILVLFIFAIFVYVILGLATFAVERPGEIAMLRAVISAIIFFTFMELYLSIRMSLFSPDASVGGVIRPWRSFWMTRSSFWRLMGLFILAGLVSMLATELGEGITPLVAFLPSLDAPLWSLPEGSSLSRTLVGDILDLLLKEPLLVLGFLALLAIQAFIIGFPYILSGLIYVQLSDVEIES